MKTTDEYLVFAPRLAAIVEAANPALKAQRSRMRSGLIGELGAPTVELRVAAIQTLRAIENPALGERELRAAASALAKFAVSKGNALARQLAGQIVLRWLDPAALAILAKASNDSFLGNLAVTARAYLRKSEELK